MSPSPAIDEEFPDLDATDAEDPQPEYGPNNEDLPEQLVNALKACIVDFQQQEKFSRRQEVRWDRICRFYEQGYQHISWNRGGWSMATPGGYGSGAGGQQVQFPTYIDDYNIFFPFLRILTAVLTQNPPGVNFQPIDPSVSEDIDKAKTAECYARAFDRMNDRNELQTQMVRFMGLSGRVVSWTRTETDGQKFGYNEDGSPKTFQCCTLYGTLETKVPILAKRLDKACLYCLIYDDPDVKLAKDEYPKFAQQIKESQAALGESSYERNARIGVLNGGYGQGIYGDTFNHTTARVNAFLRPAAFTGPEYDAPFEGGTVGDKLKQLFPEGCRATFVGDVYVSSCAESMDDHIDIQFPWVGDGLSRKGFMYPFLVVQDGFNDSMNGARENWDTGWPEMWFNAADEDIDAVRSQRSAPNAIRGWKCPNGTNLKDQNIYKTQMTELPPSFETWVRMIQEELPQFMLAAPPALFGAAMEDNKTASGYAQARSQAMGQLGIIWARIQRMFARIRYQSALAASKDLTEDKLTVPGKEGEQPITVDMERLRKGNFGCYPDEDSSFPESTMQKRTAFTSLVTLTETSPMAAQALDNPDNWSLAKRMWGLSELVIIPAEARDKQVAEIELLLQQAPLPPDPMELQQAQMQHAQGIVSATEAGGTPPPPMNPEDLMKPSVPVDELDFHQFEFAKCQEWLSSAARRTEDSKGNQAGVLNVKLHALAHQQMMALLAPPPMAAPAPAGKKAAPPPNENKPPSAPAAATPPEPAIA